MTELAASFMKHPYKVLGATPRTRLAELEKKYGETALFLDEKTADEALAALTHPTARLAADLRWFPTTEENVIEDWLRFAEQGKPGDIPPFDEDGNGSFLARFHMIRICLDKLPVETREDFSALMESLTVAADRLLPEEIIDEMNQDRTEAALPLLSDRAEVENQLQELFEETIKGVQRKAPNLIARESGQFIVDQMSRGFSSQGSSYYHSRFAQAAIRVLKYAESGTGD